MGLSFRNATPEGLFLAYLMYDEGCSGADLGEPFSGHGWYRIPAGHTVEVVSGDVGDYHRWWGYYAETDSGRFWAGPYAMTVNNEAFDQCYNIGVLGSSPQTIGFRAVVMDDDYDNFTVTLQL